MNRFVFQLWLYLFFFLSLCLLSGGCATINSSSQQIAVTNEEKIDPSCSYFYFLWGTHAEYDQHFEEALEAYEKALICDPTANYISEKIPILLVKLGKLEEAISWLQNSLAKNPEKTNQRFLLARLNIQINAIQKAIDIYQEALRNDPENRNILVRLGLLYSEQKQFTKAQSIFDNLINEDPQFYFAVLYLARLFVQSNEFSKAEKKYKEALAINRSTELTYEIADFYNLHKRHKEGFEVYESILLQDTHDERATLGAIQSLLYLTRYEEALKRLYAFRTTSQEPNKIDLIIAQILLNQKAYLQAEELLSTLLKESPTSEAYYLLAVAFFEQNFLDKALSTLQHITPESKEYEYSIFLQVKIYRSTKRINEARLLLEKNITHTKTRNPLFYIYLSSLYQDTHDMAAALDILADGISEFPRNERLHFDYGLLLETTGKSDEALSTMQKVLELDPSHTEALNFVGYTWANNNQNLQKALEYIQLAVRLKPESGYIRDSLGWVYFRLGYLEKAKTELEKALVLQPADPHIYDHLGDTYRAMINRTKALEKYRKALEMFTDKDKKKTVQEKIDALSEM